MTDTELFSCKAALPDVSCFAFPAGNPAEKMQAFVRYTGNPYLFRVDDVGVRVAYTGQNGDSLQQRICHLFAQTL